MKPVKEFNFLSNINIANITDSLNIDVGDILSGNALLNNNTLLSGILSNNSILKGGILNGNDVDVSPTIDLGLIDNIGIGDVLPVNLLSNNLASPVQLVGDLFSNSGDLSVLSNLANLDVGGINTVVTDAVDILSNVKVDDGLVNVLTDALNVDVTGNTLTGVVSKIQGVDILSDILTEPTAVVGDVLNATAVVGDVLNPTSVIGDILSPTAVLDDILSPTAVVTDLLDVANVANVVAPITSVLDADFLNTDITGNVLSNITSVLDSDIGDVGNIVATATNLLDSDVTGNLLNNVTSLIDTDVGADLVGAVTNLDVSNFGNVLADLTSVIGADTDLIGAVTNLDVSGLTGNLLSNLTSNLGLGQLGPGIDLGDVGALISAEAVTDILPLGGINSLVDQIDLFGVLDADAA